jgi:hypothetical protein
MAGLAAWARLRLQHTQRPWIAFPATTLINHQMDRLFFALLFLIFPFLFKAQESEKWRGTKKLPSKVASKLPTRRSY